MNKSLENAKEIFSILGHPVIIPNGKGPTQDKVRSSLRIFLTFLVPPQTLPPELFWESRRKIRTCRAGGATEGAILVQTTTCARWRPPSPHEGVLFKVKSSSGDGLPNPGPTLIIHPIQLSPMPVLRPPPGRGQPLQSPTPPVPGLLPHPATSKARCPLLCLTAVLPPPGSLSSLRPGSPNQPS